AVCPPTRLRGDPNLAAPRPGGCTHPMAPPAGAPGGTPTLDPTRPATLDRPAAEALSKQWWILLLAGVFSVVVGIVILSVQWTLGDLAAVVSIFLVVNGAFRTVTPPVDNSGRGWNLGVGIAEIIV